MLLNQCLALSLSPSRQEKSESLQRQARNKARNEAKKEASEINQSTALQLFERLVQENSKLERGRPKNVNSFAGEIVADAFRRIEFAGFVVPSWLLLSGTYDDLHCVKSHWASGQLCAPEGLRVETIGNIRSMNVDYFGEPRGKPSEMEPAGQRWPVSESSELEARVLCSLRWLANARQADRVGLEELAQFVNNKWPQQPAASLESVEQTSRALSQTGRLQMGKTNQTNKSTSGSDAANWFVQLPSSSPAEATSPCAPISGRNSASSTRSAKSKSTTLDSGLGGGGLKCAWDSSTSGTGSPSDEGAAHDSAGEMPPSSQMAVLEKAPQSSCSILSRLRVARSTSRRRQRPSDDANETLDAPSAAFRAKQVVDDAFDQENQQQQQQQRQQPRRGFSLTRSLSFKQPQNLSRQHQQQQAHAANKNTSATESGQAHEAGQPQQRPPEASSAAKRATSGQKPDSSRLNANLSSLFRSKSMRVVSSSSSGRATRHAANLDCDNDDDDDDDDDNDQDDDVDDELENQQRWRRRRRRDDISRARPAARGGAEATIDYLTQPALKQRNGSCSRHRRTFSMRRNSILAFGKDELGGGAGKIAMFLRRLFSIGRAGAPARRQQRDAPDDDCFAQGRPAADHSGQRDDQALSQKGRSVHHLVDIHHHHHAPDKLGKQWPPKDGSRQEECACAKQADSNNNNNNNGRPLKYGAQFDFRRQCSLHRRAADEDAVSMSASQNSLIEILNCSPSIEATKRDLRQEEARSSGASRATWKLIKRSGSSLSQRSNTSCSTNRSTVSQQLRRHLDEAYKRHRNCTSKRERDFIDSINVLRQASRHASLQNSRASSKNRRHKHSSAAGASQAAGPLKSSASQTTRRSANSSDVDDSNSSRLDSLTSPLESSASSTGADELCSPADEQYRAQVRREDQAGHFGHDGLPGADLNETTIGSPFPVGSAGQQQQWPALTGGLHDAAAPSMTGNCDCCCPLADTNQHLHSATLENAAQAANLCGQFDCCQALVNHHHHHQQASLAAALAAQPLPACCLALQTLTSQANFGVHLETPLLPPPPPPLADHLGGHLRHQHNNAGANQQLNQLALQTNNVEASNNSLCCPIWRSMIYSYCQQQQAALPFNVIAPSPPANVLAPPVPFLQSQELLPAPGQLHNRSSFSATQLSTNQQQQHNTTIDLKIEIGADFKKLAAKSARREHGLAARSISTRLRQSARNTPTASSSSDDGATDSLETGHSAGSHGLSEEGATDESLQAEPDSACESLRSAAAEDDAVSKDAGFGRDGSSPVAASTRRDVLTLT